MRREGGSRINGSQFLSKEKGNMTYEHILVEIEDGVAVITLNRSEKMLNQCP